MSPRPFLAFALVLAAAGCAASSPPNQSQLDSSSNEEAVAQDGLGAIVDATGVRFSVWAPDADRVSVAGDFNGWDATQNALTKDSGGVFSGHVDGATAGQQYEYVLQSGDSTIHKADPRARQVTNSVGKSIVVDRSAFAWQASFTTPQFNEQVVYELHLGTFNDAPGGAPGTWASAMQKLDYLADLGINMIEVMPPAEFAGDYSWGYNPAFPFAPESAYGTPDDAKAFIDAAHARGIGVLIDVVHNHYGPSDLALWCYDGPCFGSGGVYFYGDWRKSTPWGDTRPDYGRLEVRQYIVDDAMMWLREYRADGLRWDSTINIRTKDGANIDDGWRVLQEANDAVDGEQPWKIMIAEDLQNESWVTKPTSQGGAGFDSQWDAGFFHPIDDAIIAQNDGDRSMVSVRDAIAHGYNGQAMQRVIYTESHDEVANGKQRIPEMIWSGNAGSYFSRKRSTLGAAIALTSPGIPMLFMGQEFLENGYFADTRPLDWTKTSTYSGILQMYKDLIRLRRNGDATTRGLEGNGVNVFHVNDSAKVIAFHRWDQGGTGDDVVVVANFSNQAFSTYDLGFPRGGTWHVRFNSDWNGYSTDFANTPSFDANATDGGRDGLSFHGSVGLGPYAVVILSQ